MRYDGVRAGAEPFTIIWSDGDTARMSQAEVNKRRIPQGSERQAIAFSAMAGASHWVELPSYLGLDLFPGDGTRDVEQRLQGAVLGAFGLGRLRSEPSRGALHGRWASEAELDRAVDALSCLSLLQQFERWCDPLGDKELCGALRERLSVRATFPEWDNNERGWQLSWLEPAALAASFAQFGTQVWVSRPCLQVSELVLTLALAGLTRVTALLLEEWPVNDWYSKTIYEFIRRAGARCQFLDRTVGGLRWLLIFLYPEDAQRCISEASEIGDKYGGFALQ